MTGTTAADSTGPMLLGEYRRTARAARVGLFVWLLLLAGGLWCAVQLPGLPVPDTGITGDYLDPQAGTAYDLSWVGAVAGILGGLAGAAVCIYSGWAVGARTLRVTTDGFTLQHRRGHAAYRWVDVTECRFANARRIPAGITAAAPYDVTLRTSDGRRWQFDLTYSSIGELATGLPLLTAGPDNWMNKGHTEEV